MDAVERVLQELSSCELNYDQTAKAVEDYDGINIEMDHHQSLEHFAKLKFNFVELETKREFLLQTMRMQADDVVEIPKGPTKEKEELKRRKAENNEARAALEEMCQNFGQQYDEVSTLLAKTKERAQEVRALEAEVTALRATASAQQESIGGDPATYGEAAAKLDRVQRQRALAEEGLARETLQHSDTAAELERLKQALAEAEKENADTAVQLTEWKTEELRRGREQVAQVQWYQDMTACLCELGCMSVVSATVDSAHVRIKKKGGSVDVVLTFDAVSGHPTAIEIRGPIAKEIERKANDMITNGEPKEMILKMVGSAAIL